MTYLEREILNYPSLREAYTGNSVEAASNNCIARVAERLAVEPLNLEKALVHCRRDPRFPMSFQDIGSMMGKIMEAHVQAVLHDAAAEDPNILLDPILNRQSTDHFFFITHPTGNITILSNDGRGFLLGEYDNVILAREQNNNLLTLIETKVVSDRMTTHHGHSRHSRDLEFMLNLNRLQERFVPLREYASSPVADFHTSGFAYMVVVTKNAYRPEMFRQQRMLEYGGVIAPTSFTSDELKKQIETGNLLNT